jgi:hypothetical protein
MNIRVLLLGCLLALSVQAQETRRELWTWTDANGVTHFSDRPEPGARRVEVTSAAPPARPATPSAAAAARPARADAAAVTYTSLEIWQPENEASFFEADAAVDVRIRSDPEVADGDRLLFYLDGRMVDGPVNSLEYTLTNLDRGAHALTARIFDAQGKEKIRSADVTVYIKQTTTIAPRAVGPNLRPPPRPTPRGG